MRLITKYVAHLKDTMEHGFRPLKAGKMYPNALKTLPSGAPPAAQRIGSTSLGCLVVLFIYSVALSSATLLSPPGGTGG